MELPALANNTIARPLLNRPTILSKEAVKELKQLLREDMHGFYNKVNKMSKDVSEVFHIYTYMASVCEHEALRNQVCWRLYTKAFRGWFHMPDPEIIAFCKEYATDAELKGYLKTVIIPGWYDDYKPYLKMEQQLQKVADQLEEIVAQYLDFLTLKRRFIGEDQYEHILMQLKDALTIRRGNEIIGYLIDEETQEFLELPKMPKLSVKHISDA